jgi:hypothetical protein
MEIKGKGFGNGLNNLGQGGGQWDGAASLNPPPATASDLLGPEGVGKSGVCLTCGGVHANMGSDGHSFIGSSRAGADVLLTKGAIARATGPDLLAQKNAAPNDLTKPASGHPTSPVGHAFVPSR